MIFNYPLESVINHDLIKNRGSTLFSLYTIWFCNSVILIWLRCLWKLQRGYLKLKLSWFPKFLSKTVAKLHLVLLCLGKHYSTLREADRSFHCHTMSFLINQLFFFRLVVLIKKFFFISKCSCSVVRRHLLSVSWSALFSQFRRSPRIQVCKTSCFVCFFFFAFFLENAVRHLMK